MKTTDLFILAGIGLAAFLVGRVLFAPKPPANDPRLDAYFKEQEDLFK